jgi:ubiquinone/menaquinone biosynthesis C-methylase UbiE
MEYYPKGLDITAIDLTPGMLERARRRARELNVPVDLRLGDAQALEFPDHSFDAAVGTFVFCSIPDPVLGLSELRRVVRPGGRILLLEHMRSANPLIGLMMDLMNPLMAPVMGANMNRRTLENVKKSRLKVEFVEDLWAGGIFKLIAARVSDSHTF